MPITVIFVFKNKFYSKVLLCFDFSVFTRDKKKFLEILSRQKEVVVVNKKANKFNQEVKEVKEVSGEKAREVKEVSGEKEHREGALEPDKRITEWLEACQEEPLELENHKEGNRGPVKRKREWLEDGGVERRLAKRSRGENEGSEVDRQERAEGEKKSSYSANTIKCRAYQMKK